MNKNIEMTKCYTISTQDMLDIWIESFHHLDHVMAVWDARNHYELLKDLGLNLSKERLFDNKILTVQLESLDYAIEIFQKFPKFSGPFVQIYSHGKLIKDNIEN